MTTTSPSRPALLAHAALAAGTLAAALLVGCSSSSTATPSTQAAAPAPAAPKAISVLAGSPGGAGAVDGDAASARFAGLAGITLDHQGNLLVAEMDNRTIRKVNTQTGATSTWAGHLGVAGYMDGYAPDASYAGNWGMAMASDGTLYFTDLVLNGIRKITPDGLTSWVIFGGSHSYSDGVGANVRFNLPMGLALDEARGCLYVADELNMCIRKVNLATTEVTTMSGNPMVWASGGGAFAQASYNHPRALLMTPWDVLYVGCDDGILALDLKTREASMLAGLSNLYGFRDGPGFQAKFNAVSGLALDGRGSLLITEGGYMLNYCGQVMRSLDLASGIVTTLAGTGNDLVSIGSGDTPLGLGGWADGVGASVRFNMPYAMASDQRSAAYITDTGNNVIRKYDFATGAVSTLAGTGPRQGWADGAAGVAAFDQPFGIATDAAGNAYVADVNNHVIRKITPQGLVSTLAGQPRVAGHADGKGSAATFNAPYDLTVDKATGNVFVADYGNNCIRKITPDGTVSTFAGVPGSGGWQDGAAGEAYFSGPEGIVFASDGNLYVADTWNSLIRVVGPDGSVGTYAGSGSYALTDGIGTAADFAGPSGITDDLKGHLIVMDTYNYAVRSIDMSTTQVSTLAGGARSASTGNPLGGAADGTGSEARFETPIRVLADPRGFYLVSDYYNNAVRKVTPEGVVTTVIGDISWGQSSLPGIKLGDLPGQATLPIGLARTPDGTILLLTDNCVLKVTGIN